METFRKRYKVPVGYSGHEAGIHVSVAAAALGACVVERHVTLNRKMSGPDHSASIEMDELAAMVRQIRDVEQALGTATKTHYKDEDVLVGVLGKSVVSAARIPAGARITRAMLTTKGPSSGIPAAKLSSLIGKRARAEIAADTLIMPSHVR